MKHGDVTRMTKNELYRAIRDKNSEPEFIKACIKERDRRMNVYIQECIHAGVNAGAD
jgi:hypothetical protein